MVEKKDKGTKETKIKDHKREHKKLIPPFGQLGNISKSSWFGSRLPEMLWAVIAIGNLQREKALDFFRHVAKFVEENKECYDVTLTGISKFPKDKREAFIKYIVGWSPGIKETLRPLLLFPSLPSIEDWQKELPKPEERVDWEKLAEATAKTFWHQSQEATDCRWIKLFCHLLGGKLKFVEKQDEKGPGIEGKIIDERLGGLYEYPNYGDMKSVRPFIRAGEIGLDLTQDEKGKKWGQDFWQFCFDHTTCLPEDAINKKAQTRKKELSDEIEKARKHYFGETVKLRNELIDHAIKTASTSAIDSRHEGAFGLALYSLTLFIEIIFYHAPLSITGRLALRSLVETQITFAYLLKKEKEETGVWEDYRGYGTGQAKLIYLKLQELSNAPEAIDFDQLEQIANEDQWVEFTPINLGHWDSTDLRKMSEEVGLKELYDQFYNYTSGHMHANWSAVRETVYQRCMNPLHRYHRVPTFDLPLMPNIIKDAESIINSIMQYLSDTYPKFDGRIKTLAQEKSVGKEEKI